MWLGSFDTDKTYVTRNWFFYTKRILESSSSNVSALTKFIFFSVFKLLNSSIGITFDHDSPITSPPHTEPSKKEFVAGYILVFLFQTWTEYNTPKFRLLAMQNYMYDLGLYEGIMNNPLEFLNNQVHTLI